MKKTEDLSWAETRALINENNKSIKEDHKKWKEELKQSRKEWKEELKQSRKEFQEELKRSSKEFQESMKQLSESQKETDKMIKENAKLINGISTSNGEFCEEYFVNSFKENPTFLGERFDRVIDNLKPDPMIVNDQYDLVLRNGKTIVIIEMKYKAKVSDVKKMRSKLYSYRANYPMFSGYKVYLCLASFRFRDYVKVRAAAEGIVLVQQRGERIEVVSENLKYW